MMPDMTTPATPVKAPASAAAIALMEAAEALIAQHGIDGVSSREIARRAGQKNHSAVNYNFGSFEGLVEALIEYRVAPINAARETELARLQAHSPLPALEDLVGLMIRPMAEELLDPSGQHHYLNLMAQLLARRRWREVFMRNRGRSQALQAVASLVEAHLQDTVPERIRQERLRLLGSHIVHTVAEWEALQRDGELCGAADLAWRLDDFITYSVAGLRAPAATARAQ